MSKEKLIYICTSQEIDFYEYKCKLFKYNYKKIASYEKRLSHKIRATLSFLRKGYRIFYLFKKDERGDKIVGNGVIERGGGRYKFCTKNDAVLCSLYIVEEERGKGLGKILVNCLVNIANEYNGSIYEFISPTNLSSIKVALANGFKKKCSASTKGLLNSFYEDENGSVDIYCKTK